MPCGQNGRVDQLCTSRTGPMAPASTHSVSSAVDSSAEAQNMCVAEPVSRAVRTTSCASASTLPSGLWVITCLPALIPASATVAWWWSGVMT